MIGDLGLERLLCITQFRLGAYDEAQHTEWENLYLVADPNNGPVCVASL